MRCVKHGRLGEGDVSGGCPVVENLVSSADEAHRRRYGVRFFVDA